MGPTPPLPSLDAGLSASEVSERRLRGQTNRVVESTSRSLASIARENLLTLFNGILVTAMLVVLVVGDWRDAVFGMVMVLNVIIGVASEYRAKRTLDTLAIIDAPRALVLRDGQESEVLAEDLVLDDVVRLRLGDQVPVDGRILEARGLEIDESLLTGESAPVRRQTGDRVLAGTSVVAGTGLLHATAVGEDLYAQSITRQARSFSLATSELQQGINRVLAVISWAIVPVLVLATWSQLRVAGDGDLDAWRHALVLAVASVVGLIPQGLVLLTSMNFALGSATLARRGVLVQELAAVEVLARVDALCLDKTGTLTTGGIRVRELLDVSQPGSAEPGPAGPAARDALVTLCADRGNATARAIADHLGSGASAEDAPWSVSFSSARKWSAWGDARGSWVLGAPEIVLDQGDPSGRSALRRAADLAAQGLRVVALASAAAPGTPEEDPQLPASRRPEVLVVLEEDVRPDAADTLAYFRSQGVAVRVISGDNPVTVGTLARSVGLRAPDGSEARLCDARELPRDLESPEFDRAVVDHDVFGRVTPEQKRAMVASLQRAGHSVAMTGDGVNDALALKDADLGIAMGSGADATKAVAQLVLVDGRFSSLPGVVAEGRRIIANMERVSALFLAKTTYTAVLVVLTSALAWSFPFLPRHYTYIDAFTIGIPAFVIALGPNARRYVPGFLRRTLWLAVPSGFVLAAAAVAAYAATGINTTIGQTVAALTLMMGALWLVSITARPLVPWRAALLVAMAAGSVLGVLIPFSRHFFALEWPDAAQWAVVLGVGALACAAVEVAHRARGLALHREAEKAGAALPAG